MLGAPFPRIRGTGNDRGRTEPKAPFFISKETTFILEKGVIYMFGYKLVKEDELEKMKKDRDFWLGNAKKFSDLFTDLINVHYIDMETLKRAFYGHITDLEARRAFIDFCNKSIKTNEELKKNVNCIKLIMK